MFDNGVAFSKNAPNRKENMAITLRKLKGKLGSRKTPVILIPGITGQAKKTFSILKNLFESDRLVYVLDFDSSTPRFYTIEDFVTECYNLIDSEFSSNFVVGGWSFGGILAYELAKMYEDQHRMLPGLHIFDTNFSVVLPKLQAPQFREKILDTLQTIVNTVMPNEEQQTLFRIKDLIHIFESFTLAEDEDRDVFLVKYLGKLDAHIQEISTILRETNAPVTEMQADNLLNIHTQLSTCLYNFRLLVAYTPIGSTNTPAMVVAVEDGLDKGYEKHFPNRESVLIKNVTHLSILTTGAGQLWHKIKGNLQVIDSPASSAHTPPLRSGSSSTGTGNKSKRTREDSEGGLLSPYQHRLMRKRLRSSIGKLTTPVSIFLDQDESSPGPITDLTPKSTPSKISNR